MTACVDEWAEWPMPNSAADVSAGAPNRQAYADDGDGTVTDRVTGLIWQKEPSPTQLAQSAAVTYCASLVLSGVGWRLPSVVELVSIVDTGSSEPSIDAGAFPDTPSSAFWSATPVASLPGDAFDVAFDAGNVSRDDASTPFYARCVRSPSVDAATAYLPAPQRYASSNGTVHDMRTKLTWQQSFATSNYSEADSEGYCGSLGVDGSGWRLPTVKELLTLVDFDGALSPTIDPTSFPDTPEDEFWTATAYAAGSDRGFGVDFSYGVTYTTVSSIPYNARCVR